MAHMLITGGTGFIGSALVKELQAQGHSLSVLIHKTYCKDPTITTYTNLDAIPDTIKFTSIINLAGAPIDQRWTQKTQQKIYDSRIHITQNIVALIKRLKTKPKTLLSASAIGYYGAQNNHPLNEQSQPHDEWSHQLCQAWEQAANQASKENVRTCIMRLGIVLAKQGGALKKMLPAFYLGLGGPLGHGKQIMSWIHLEDVIQIILFLLDHPNLNGPFNLTAPTKKPTENKLFASTLAATIKRPCWLNMPPWIIQLLFGEMGNRLLLHGQFVTPNNLLQAHYPFRYYTLKHALNACLTSS
jgi:uncharacterized protein